MKHIIRSSQGPSQLRYSLVFDDETEMLQEFGVRQMHHSGEFIPYINNLPRLTLPGYKHPELDAYCVQYLGAEPMTTDEIVSNLTNRFYAEDMKWQRSRSEQRAEEHISYAREHFSEAVAQAFEARIRNILEIRKAK